MLLDNLHVFSGLNTIKVAFFIHEILYFLGEIDAFSVTSRLKKMGGKWNCQKS